VFDVCEGLQGVYRSESKDRGKGDGAAEKVAVFQMWERVEGTGEWRKSVKTRKQYNQQYQIY
jgi:hypothetical protein